MSPNEQMPARSKGSAASPYPAFIEPALAKTKDAPPSGPQWLHELKLDGYRI
jgi:bifunctional non-homologous end joining protein LigD